MHVSIVKAFLVAFSMHHSVALRIDAEELSQSVNGRDDETSEFWAPTEDIDYEDHGDKSLKVAQKDFWVSTVKANSDGSHAHAASGWGYLSDEQFDRKITDAISHMSPEIKQGDTLFEFGMGVGAALKVLISHFPGLRVGGSDVTKEAVEAAREALSDYGNTNPLFPMLVQDMRVKHASIPDESFDHVVSFGALAMYLQKDEMLQVIAEAVRLTKPGGSLMFSDFDVPGKTRSSSSVVCPVEKSFWATSLPELGLEDVQIHATQYHHHQGDRYIVSCRKSAPAKDIESAPAKDIDHEDKEDASLNVAQKDFWVSTVKANSDGSHPHAASGWGYLSDEQFDRKITDAISHMSPEIKAGGTLFEFGMGVGAALKVLITHFPGLRVGGSDVTEEAVDVAREALAEYGTTHALFPMLVQDMRVKHASIADESFDHVVSFGALAMYLQKDEMLQVIAEAVRLTKPGGSLMFSDFDEPGNTRSSSSVVCPVEKSFWATSLPKLGLEGVEIHATQYHHQEGDRYIVSCRKRSA